MLISAVFVPSMMSVVGLVESAELSMACDLPISPVRGQSGPSNQYAGHVPHPVGMWRMSMMNKP